MSKKLRGSIMLLMTAMIWGLAFVAQSDGMNYVGPFTYNASRTLLGGVVLIPVIALFRLIPQKNKADAGNEGVTNSICTSIRKTN